MCLIQFTVAQTKSTIDKYISLEEKLHIGDEFTYIAKFAFLNLGELRIKVYEKDTIDQEIIYKSIAYIDSYEGLPFLELHQVYESWFDSSLKPVYFHVVKVHKYDSLFCQ